MIFDDLEKDLHNIAVDLNDMMEKLQNIKTINSDILSSIHDDISCLENRFNVYKKSSNKYFKKMIFSDKTLRILFVVICVIVAITIIA